MKHYQPAIYICADCNIEHYGDRQNLPVGWNRFTTARGHDAVHCGNCVEQVADLGALHPGAQPTIGMAFGILAARYTGALILASDLPAREPRQ